MTYMQLPGKKIWLFFLFWILICSSVVHAEDGRWRLDGDGGSQLPYNFRLASDDWHRTFEGEGPSRSGLDDLHVSASAQPSLEELPVLYDTLKKNAPNSSQIYIIDLRQESHGYADNYPISWHKKRNIANFGMDAAAVEKDETRRLHSLLGHETTFIPMGNSDTKRFSEKTFAPSSVSTEKEAAEAAGFRYLRIAASDQMWPDDSAVDSFLEFVRTLPQDAWLHFHCQAGHGRTSTFLSIYDIMRNPDVDLEDIVKRHYLQGGTDLLAPAQGDSWYAVQNRRRAKMIRLFYRYAHEYLAGETALSWGEWLKKE